MNSSKEMNVTTGIDISSSLTVLAVLAVVILRAETVESTTGQRLAGSTVLARIARTTSI